ncbi:MAG: DUF493 domain-containing protein [Deltaproteobacteria bacterium]|nr:MAG: DUF493 domain-containing protein [Deltaproteobacteria bacterium]
MAEKTSPFDLMEYPCAYSFKIFTNRRDLAEFEVEMTDCARQCADSGPPEFQRRSSSAGNYTCFTMTIQVQGKGQIEALYQSLRRLHGVCYLL